MRQKIILFLSSLLALSLGINVYFFLTCDVLKPYRTPLIYPNPVFTPGDVFPQITEKEICTPGYTKEVRAVSKKTKQQVFRNYRVPYPPPRGAYEVDHFIPLELGGSNDIKNLWPEPAEPRPGFHEKDTVENDLHEKVCNGKMSLKDAQEQIRKDWYGVYKNTAK